MRASVLALECRAACCPQVRKPCKPLVHSGLQVVRGSAPTNTFRNAHYPRHSRRERDRCQGSGPSSAPRRIPLTTASSPRGDRVVAGHSLAARDDRSLPHPFTRDRVQVRVGHASITSRQRHNVARPIPENIDLSFEPFRMVPVIVIPLRNEFTIRARYRCVAKVTRE
jgi:hypothetical protein